MASRATIATDHIAPQEDDCLEAALGVWSHFSDPDREKSRMPSKGSDRPISISSVVLGDAHRMGGGVRTRYSGPVCKRTKEDACLQDCAAKIPRAATQSCTAHADVRRALQRQPHSFLEWGFGAGSSRSTVAPSHRSPTRESIR